MKNTKKKQEEIEYNRIVKLVDKAEKEAKKFIQNNIHLDAQLRVKCT